jgi:hypothetical protein
MMPSVVGAMMQHRPSLGIRLVDWFEHVVLPPDGRQPGDHSRSRGLVFPPCHHATYPRP